MDGYVFVNGGQALTIEAGTIVKGAAGSGVDAAAMIVSAGGQIFAEGTEDCPIIFTFEGDALDGSTSYNTRGQWGGLIVLGDATTNFGGPAQVEGIPTDNNQATYGGSNDEDNSGVLTYVSIRHGGTQLGAANEINGLTLAGVGSGTTIHHVEVVSNLDDGIEFFGGAVTVDQALVAFCGDDSFDWDQGYHGGGSQWLAVQDQPTGEGDRGGELDGDDSDDSNVSADEMPFATPTIEGWTVVGVGGQQGLLFRNGSGGHVSNGLLCNTSEGIEIEDKTDEVEDAYQRFLAGDLTLTNIVVTGGGAALDYDGEATDGADVLNAYAEANGVISGSVDGLDDMFDFDPSGTFALDPLNVEVGQGSGHAWTAGWTLRPAWTVHHRHELGGCGPHLGRLTLPQPKLRCERVGPACPRPVQRSNLLQHGFFGGRAHCTGRTSPHAANGGWNLRCRDFEQRRNCNPQVGGSVIVNRLTKKPGRLAGLFCALHLKSVRELDGL